MKKLITAILILISFSVHSQSVWTAIGTPGMQRLITVGPPADTLYRFSNGSYGFVYFKSLAAMNAALALKINLTEKAAANGVATLDAAGKVPSNQIPALAISETFVVASQAAMLALSTAETGDVAVRTDINKSLILTDSPYSTLANWQELLTPTDAVQSVNGQTGTVSLTTSHIAEGSNLYHTTARVNAVAPTLTGTGANGTWGIGITGNASTATLAANSTLWGGADYEGPYLPLTGGTLNGALIGASASFNNGSTNPVEITNTSFSSGVYGLIKWGTGTVLTDILGIWGREALKGLIYSAPTTGFHEFRVNNVTGLAVSETAVTSSLPLAGTTISTSGLDTYTSDLSGSYTARTKIDKGYADANYSPIGSYAPVSGSVNYFQNQAATDQVITMKGQISVYGSGGVGTYPYNDRNGDGFIAHQSSTVSTLYTGEKIRFGNNSFTQTLRPATLTANSDITLGNGSGVIMFISDVTSAPSSSTATGAKGEVRIVGTDRYECTATNTWVKSTVVVTF